MVIYLHKCAYPNHLDTSYPSFRRIYKKMCTYVKKTNEFLRDILYFLM